MSHYDLKDNLLRQLTFFLQLLDNSLASNWSLSMTQCTKSQPSTYLLGDNDLNDPHLA